MQIDLAQELLLSRRVDLVVQSISVSSHGRVFDMHLFQLVICYVRVHRDDGSEQVIC